MICYVYRSNRKNFTYLYMKEQDDFSCVPESVLKVFGEPEFSLSFLLKPDKQLAQADTQHVIDQLETEGFYLQLPKSDYDMSKIEQKIIDSIESSN